MCGNPGLITTENMRAVSCHRTFQLGAFSDISKCLGLCTVLPVCYMPLKSFFKQKELCLNNFNVLTSNQHGAPCPYLVVFLRISKTSTWLSGMLNAENRIGAPGICSWEFLSMQCSGRCFTHYYRAPAHGAACSKFQNEWKVGFSLQ